MVDAIPPDYLVFLFTAPILLGIMFFILVFRIRKLKSESNTMHLNLFFFCSLGFLLMNFLEFTAFSIEWTLFWARASYPFFVFLPSLWFILIVRLTSGEPRLPILVYPAVFLIPLATLILVFIDACRPLIWANIMYRLVGPFTVMDVRHGIWFFIYAAHTYILSLAGVVIFVLRFRFRNRAYAFKSAFVILGIAVPLLPSVFYVFDLFPGLNKDFTPVGYGVSGLLFAFGISKKRLFSMVPFARSILVEQMRDGIVVLDRNGFIVDMNPSALRLFQMAREPVGLLFEEAAGFPEAVKDIVRAGEAREISIPLMVHPEVDSKVVPELDPEMCREVEPEQGDRCISAFAQGDPDPSPVPCLSPSRERDVMGSRYFLGCVNTLKRHGREIGKLLTLRETTDSHILLKKIEEQAFTDELTGICNRRQFLVRAEQFFSLSKRHSLHLSLVMIDIDHFKDVNDSYGHQAGDAVIIAVSRMIASRLRSGDIFARIGGDEFALLLPETILENARLLCELFREQIAENPVILTPSGFACQITISVGAADHSKGIMTLSDLLSAADRALYHAKETGRNRVSTCSDGDFQQRRQRELFPD